MELFTEKQEIEFTKKQEVLEQARISLKKEFVGIDNIIDEIITNVSPWFLLAEFQDRPTVINLWGLTGVGKTSLITRLAALLDYSSLYYRFDMANHKNGSEFSSGINDLCNNPDNTPIIIALDEFQHARTILGGLGREEKQDDSNRLVWELLDTGKLTVSLWKRGIWDFIETTNKLRYLLKRGVKVENGLIVEGQELYNLALSDYFREKEDKNYFYPTRDYDDILSFSDGELGFTVESDVKERLLKLNGYETIEFLEDVAKIARKPKEKSFAQSLIFVMANIDEAYTMSSDYSPDIDADSFHEMSLKITVPIIKNALRNRFRDEQIARLGNIHLIYPSLNKAAYQRIIEMELQKVIENYKRKLNLVFEFDSSIHAEIYSEGVLPAQGARQVFTTIHQLVKSKLTIFITDILLQNLEVDKLQLSIEDGFLICAYFNQGEVIHRKKDKVISKINKLRKNRKDDKQAIVAVHESGHAILHAALLNQVPELAKSVTADVMREGFVSVKSETVPPSRKNMINYVAMLLGGLVAEEMVFGKENLTSGSASDIKTATNLVFDLYKSNGFGENAIFFAASAVNPENGLHDIADLESEIQSVIAKAKQLAEKTLQSEKRLLLELATHLSNNTSIKKAEIEALIEKYGVNFTSISRTKDYYRNILIRETAQLVSDKVTFQPRTRLEVMNSKSNIREVTT